jgi:hypothetical protein
MKMPGHAEGGAKALGKTNVVDRRRQSSLAALRIYSHKQTNENARRCGASQRLWVRPSQKFGIAEGNPAETAALGFG